MDIWVNRKERLKKWANHPSSINGKNNQKIKKKIKRRYIIIKIRVEIIEMTKIDNKENKQNWKIVIYKD